MRKLKDMTGPQLRQAIKTEAHIYSDALDSCLDQATVLHAGQVRKDPVQGRLNTPYIEHPQRNVLRLIRWGCEDEGVLVATGFHDAVEDCALIFAPHAACEAEAREALRADILRQHGPVVLAMVDGVTNPLQSKERRALSDAEKFEAYCTQVERKIRLSVGIFLVKLTDLVDNAGSLHHTPAGEAKKAKRLATKYLPLIPIFRSVAAEYALNYPVLIDWDEIDAVLARIEARLIEILRG